VKIIASIEDPQLIGRILEHLGLGSSEAHSHQLPPARFLGLQWNVFDRFDTGKLAMAELPLNRL
jgi:hypothetical protein